MVELMSGVRVGVVISSEHAGGAEQYLVRLFGGLRHFDVSATLLGALRDWEGTGFDRRDIGLGPKWSKRSALASLRELPQIRRGVLGSIKEAHQEIDFTLFHAQFKREQLMLTSHLSKLAPVLWTEHGRFPRGRGSKALANRYAAAARNSACIVCVGQTTADDVREVCGPRVRIEVIPNAVDLNRFRPLDQVEREAARAALGLASDRLVLVVVCRLQLDKRVERAIEAAQSIEAVLLVAGEGSERSRLESIAQSSGAEVRFLGHVDRPEHIYGAADAAFICASPQEGHSHNLSSLEAAASGCPLIGFEGDPTDAFVIEAGGVLLRKGASIAATLDSERLSDAAVSARAAATQHGEPGWLNTYHSLLKEFE